jgi:hypothetical protein
VPEAERAGIGIEAVTLRRPPDLIQLYGLRARRCRSGSGAGLGLATSCVDRLVQAALGAAGRRVTAEAERAVIADDGREITLTTHVGAQAQAVIVLDPLRAVALAGELITAAQRHLAHTAESRRSCRRGDPKAACRRERDAAASALAQLLAPGQPLEEQARIVVDRVARYQPVAGKLGADRQLMDQIKAAGLPLPSADRVARIIRSAANKRNEGRQVGS